MDENLIHRPAPTAPEAPKHTDGSNRRKILIAAGAVIVVGLGFYFLFASQKDANKGKEVLIPSSESILGGILVEKKSDSIGLVVSPNPPAPGQKPELYTVKISPQTSFFKVDKSQPDMPEYKITLDDLEISQEVFAHYTMDKQGNLNARRISWVVRPAVSGSNLEKAK